MFALNDRARFSSQAACALRYAQESAKRRGHARIEPAHLLLGLLRDDHFEARHVVAEQQASVGQLVEALSRYLDTQPAPSPGGPPPVSLPLSADAESVLDRALELASREGRSFVGTEHIMRALLWKPAAQIGAIYEKLGVEAPHVPSDEVITATVQAVRPPLWNRYSRSAQQAILHAQTEAVRSGWNTISPPFLLAGLLQEEGTPVETILTACGIARNTLRMALVDLLTTGPGCSPQEPIALDGEALPLIGEAHRVMSALEDSQIGPEHLLVGMLQDSGPAGQLLRAHGLTAEAVWKVFGKTRQAGVPVRRNWARWVAHKGSYAGLALLILMIVVFLVRGCLAVSR